MKFGKWVSGLAVTSILLGSTAPALAAPQWTVQAYDEGGVQVLLKFKDLKEAEWALRFIAAMEAEGIFKGYEDGTFKPNQAINRAEAVVTAVKLMGLGAEAEAKQNVNLNFKDADLIKRDYGWATGYIAVALEKGLFDSVENELQPGTAASRVWVSTLLVRALGYENEALAKMNTSLSFTDKDSIPAASVGYIAVAVEKGILKGYPDGTFQPNNPVTRAEMAALLHNSDSALPTELKKKKKQKNMEVEGVVTAITGNSLTVQDEDRGEVQINLSDKILVFRDGGRGTTSDIAVGDKVEIKLTNGRAVLIEVEREAQKVKGTVVSVTETTYPHSINRPLGSDDFSNGKVYNVVLNTDQGQRSFYVTSRTDIKVEGVSHPTVADIKTGSNVEAKLWGNAAVEVKVLKGEDDTAGKFEVNGKLVKIDTNSVTVKKADQTEVHYDLAADLKIRYKGHPDAKLTDLTAGLDVQVKGNNNLVHEILIEE